MSMPGARNFPFDGQRWKDPRGTSEPGLVEAAFWGTLLFGAVLIVLALFFGLLR